MGLGRDATTYGFCKENREDMVECGREMTRLVLNSYNMSSGLSKIILFNKVAGVQKNRASGEYH